VEFTVRIPLLTQKDHEQVPYLIAMLSMSHLNEQKAQVIEQEFRV
jgi:hypothetical protein